MSYQFAPRLGLQASLLLLLSLWPALFAASCRAGDQLLPSGLCAKDCRDDDSPLSDFFELDCGDSFFFSKVCCKRQVLETSCYCARSVSSRGIIAIVFIVLAILFIVLFIIFMLRRKRSKVVDVANNHPIQGAADHSGLDSLNSPAALSSYPSDRPSNAQPPPGYPSGGISNHSTPHDSQQFSTPPNFSPGTAHHPQLYPETSVPAPPPHAPGSHTPYSYDSDATPPYTSAPQGLYPQVAPLPPQPSAPESHMVYQGVYHGTGQQW